MSAPQLRHHALRGVTRFALAAMACHGASGCVTARRAVPATLVQSSVNATLFESATSGPVASRAAPVVVGEVPVKPSLDGSTSTETVESEVANVSATVLGRTAPLPEETTPFGKSAFAGGAVDAHTRWVVIAPHPDDEALMASGVLLHAVTSGVEAAVIVMTNGDLDCLYDGIRREGETVAGVSALGVPEDRVFFLGYPDGSLGRLGRAPLPPTRRLVDGRCVLGNTTYGARGFGGRDYHSVRFGSSGLNTRENLVADLASLLEDLRPTDVVITHLADTHPDHAAAYALFRSAMDRVSSAPRVHRGIVHNGDCWPTGTVPREPCPVALIAPDEPLPALWTN